MNIIEATKKAVDNNKCITRSDVWWGKTIKIQPTNDAEGFITYNTMKNTRSPRWQPQAADILADDWVQCD